MYRVIRRFISETIQVPLSANLRYQDVASVISVVGGILYFGYEASKIHHDVASIKNDVAGMLTRDAARDAALQQRDAALQQRDAARDAALQQLDAALQGMMGNIMFLLTAQNMKVEVKSSQVETDH